MKILIVFCILVTITILLSADEVRNDTKSEKPNPYDDVSLSEDTEHKINKITDNETRSYFMGQAKAIKYYKTRLNPTLGFVAFQCAINEMRADMEVLYPTYRTSKDYWRFTDGLEREFEFPRSLDDSIRAFTELELQMEVKFNHRSTRKIPSFFYSMYACLTRCYIPEYSVYLSKREMEIARALRSKLLKFHGLTENDDRLSIREALKKFSIMYARVRHGVNGLHHIYIYQCVLRNSSEFLPKLLNKLGLLQAWSFSRDDLAYVNLIRDFLTPNNALNILPASYELQFVNTKGENVSVMGILPYLNVEACPRLSIPI